MVVVVLVVAAAVVVVVVNVAAIVNIGTEFSLRQPPSDMIADVRLYKILTVLQLYD